MTPARDTIRFTGVRKRYGGQQVLSGIDLAIAPGEFIGLVGVNGAGKTTLIKCLLDFISPDAGQITVSGVAHDRPQARQSLAYLPEKFMPPYYLAGRDFLDYMAGLYGVKTDLTQRHAILATLDFDPLMLAKPVRRLSKGMSQKLGLAACLLSGRDLFILDEPMSGLDPKARAFLKRYIRGLKEQGKTLFFSTHMLADVEALCDRVAIMHAGTIRFSGPPRECCECYQTDDFESAYLACVGS